MSEERLRIEREWIEADDKHTAIREEALKARRKGDLAAAASLTASLKEATARRNQIMAAYQTVIGAERNSGALQRAGAEPPVAEPMQGSPPAHAQEPAVSDPAQEIIEALAPLIIQANQAAMLKTSLLLALLRAFLLALSGDALAKSR